MASEQPNHSVSLGCGTLILIAVIVSIFSNGNSDMERDVRQLRNDVKALRPEVAELRQEVEELHVLLDAIASNKAEAE